MEQSFYDEFGYLCYKYFSQSSVEPCFTYSNVLVFFNNIQYDYYKINNNTELFIPYGENVLYNDFDDIYVLKLQEPYNFVFKVISRNDGIIRIKDYEYMNNKGQITTSYTYREIDDKAGIVSDLFEKSGISIDEFIINDYFMKIDETNEMISSSIMKNNEVRNFITSFTDIDNCMVELDDALLDNKYQKIEKNKQLLMEINEDLIVNKLKNKIKGV